LFSSATASSCKKLDGSKRGRDRRSDKDKQQDKRRRTTPDEPAFTSTHIPRLACLYNKYDPMMYRSNAQTLKKFEISSTSRTTTPLRSTVTMTKAHQTASEPCTLVPLNVVKRIQWMPHDKRIALQSAVSRHLRGGTDEEKWRFAYRWLFPETDPDEIPYLQDPVISIVSSVVDDFEARLRELIRSSTDLDDLESRIPVIRGQFLAQYGITINEAEQDSPSLASLRTASSSPGSERLTTTTPPSVADLNHPHLERDTNHEHFTLSSNSQSNLNELPAGISAHQDIPLGPLVSNDHDWLHHDDFPNIDDMPSWDPSTWNTDPETTNDISNSLHVTENLKDLHGYICVAQDPSHRFSYGLYDGWLDFIGVKDELYCEVCSIGCTIYKLLRRGYTPGSAMITSRQYKRTSMYLPCTCDETISFQYIENLCKTDVASWKGKEEFLRTKENRSKLDHLRASLAVGFGLCLQWGQSSAASASVCAYEAPTSHTLMFCVETAMTSIRAVRAQIEVIAGRTTCRVGQQLSKGTSLEDGREHDQVMQRTDCKILGLSKGGDTRRTFASSKRLIWFFILALSLTTLRSSVHFATSSPGSTVLALRAFSGVSLRFLVSMPLDSVLLLRVLLESFASRSPRPFVVQLVAFASQPAVSVMLPPFLQPGRPLVGSIPPEAPPMLGSSWELNQPWSWKSAVPDQQAPLVSVVPLFCSRKASSTVLQKFVANTIAVPSNRSLIIGCR
ncbi:hypothetical protein KCU77_g104, partial [Aureobasidium melanogenum]